MTIQLLNELQVNNLIDLYTDLIDFKIENKLNEIQEDSIYKETLNEITNSEEIKKKQLDLNLFITKSSSYIKSINNIKSIFSDYLLDDVFPESQNELDKYISRRQSIINTETKNLLYVKLKINSVYKIKSNVMSELRTNLLLTPYDNIINIKLQIENILDELILKHTYNQF